jgi:hypothetical protein
MGRVLLADWGTFDKDKFKEAIARKKKTKGERPAAEMRRWAEERSKVELEIILNIK